MLNKGRNAPAREIRFVGEVESRLDAEDLLERPGDVVLVNRGCLRSIVFSCPDGCGSVLTINLDSRTGPAWRIYNDKRGLTLYPSVWRDSGCEAHFIVWRNRILWCSRNSTRDGEPPYDLAIQANVKAALTSQFQTAYQIALLIDEIPWEVARAAGRLVMSGDAEEEGTREKRYRRRRSQPA